MRFGCCLNMLVPPERGTGVAFAAAVRAAGFDYLELPVRRVAALAPAAFAELEGELHAVGLPCEAGNDFLPATVPVVGPAADAAQQCAYVAAIAERLERLGVTTVVFGSADARRRPAGVAPAAADAQIRDFLLGIVPILRRHGLTVAIEHLNRQEGNTLTSLADAAAMVRAIGQPEIRLLADYFHLMREGEPLERVAEHADLLAHVHVSHPRHRAYPTHSDVDLARFGALLRRGGYDRRISVEGFTEALASDGPAALRTLRALMAPSVAVSSPALESRS